MLYFIAIATGLFATAQSGLNSLLIERWGLPYVIGANALVCLALVALLFLGAQVLPNHGQLAEYIKAPDTWTLPWWAILPGLLGGLIMMGFAYSFESLGAAPTTLIIIATQIFASFAWDYFAKGAVPSWIAVLGGGICALGAVVALHWGKS